MDINQIQTIEPIGPDCVLLQGLADELNMEGACDRAIYPDENIAITSCAMDGYLVEGVGSRRCSALLSSHSFMSCDPCANIAGGSVQAGHRERMHGPRLRYFRPAGHRRRRLLPP